jgi:hypothetical protein
MIGFYRQFNYRIFDLIFFLELNQFFKKNGKKELIIFLKKFSWIL